MLKYKIPQIVTLTRIGHTIISGGSANKKGSILLRMSLSVCGPAWA